MTIIPANREAAREGRIVVDIGCATYQRGGGFEDSIATLIKRFQPLVLFGFDINPELKDGIGRVGGTTVITARRAAWEADGEVPVSISGNTTHVGIAEDDVEPAWVPSFDLASWLASLPAVEIILKIDAEGAEYVLLPHLIARKAMRCVSRLLVEWHGGKYANGYEISRDAILADVKCPMEEWQ